MEERPWQVIAWKMIPKFFLDIFFLYFVLLGFTSWIKFFAAPLWFCLFFASFWLVLHCTYRLTSFSVTSVAYFTLLSLALSLARLSTSFGHLLPEWPLIRLMANEHVSLTFTIKYITNSTAVLLIFEDFNNSSTDFESVYKITLSFNFCGFDTSQLSAALIAYNSTL